jgi:hypothetical protein
VQYTCLCQVIFVLRYILCVCSYVFLCVPMCVPMWVPMCVSKVHTYLCQIVFVLRDIRLGEEEVGLLYLFCLLRVVLCNKEKSYSKTKL